MRSNLHAFVSVAAFAVLAAAPSSAVARGTLYDDFSAPMLDASKWLGYAGADVYWLDLSRRTGAGLDIVAVGYAPTTDDADARGGAFGIQMTTPQNVNGVAYTFTVNQVKVVPCSSSSQPIATSTDFEASFFNAQGGTQFAGDVELSLAAVRDGSQSANAPLNVIANAWECMDSSCTRNDLFNQTIGTVKIGKSNNVTAIWDKKHHQFSFNLNGTRTNLGYSVADNAPPYYAYKVFDVQRYTPDCTASKRPYSLMDATVGPIYINP